MTEQPSSDFRTDRVGTALAGTNPTVIRRMRAGFAVIGDQQHLPGYCVLLTDTPGVEQLTDLPLATQRLFLDDMRLLGEAVGSVCSRLVDGYRRINLEIQGNTDAFLHAHVTPRYHWEDAEVLGWPAALHWWTGRAPAAGQELAPQHDALRAGIGAALDELLERAEQSPAQRVT